MNSMNPMKSQLSLLLENDIPETIFREVYKLFCYHYKPSSFSGVAKTFYQVTRLFNGLFPGYKACNTGYHDLEHTLETFLAAARLLDGYNLSYEKIPVETAINLLIAALLHDSGYIQELSETKGTGARFTQVHVQRSITFLNENHSRLNIAPEKLYSIKRLIQSTDHTINFDTIYFDSSNEHAAAAILATADLLGQMGNRSYLEKLSLLYSEFSEAKISGFSGKLDFYRNSLSFYKNAQIRFIYSYKEVYKLARVHFEKRFGIDMNLYTRAIKKQLLFLEFLLKQESPELDEKLKRGENINRSSMPLPSFLGCDPIMSGIYHKPVSTGAANGF
ncbi:MAG: hypothetical protein GY754_23965 [bacterium]|nr:hypothetical protein [bacterium]